MGLFDKLTKKRMLILDYANEIADLKNIQESIAKLFIGYITAAQVSSYANGENNLLFINPEEPFKERAFWNAYFTVLRQGFGGAQLLCDLDENRNIDITMAFYNTVKLSHASLMEEMISSEEPKGVQPFSMPPTMRLSGEKTWMIPLLDYLHYTGNSEEHLEYFMTVDACVEGFFDFMSTLEQQFLPILNEAIFTDWEQYSGIK